MKTEGSNPNGLEVIYFVMMLLVKSSPQEVVESK